VHETNPWTRHAPLSILVLLFLSGVVITTPPAQAVPTTFVFEEIDTFGMGGDSSGGRNHVSTVFSSSDVIVTGYQNNGDTFVRRCVISTDTCSSTLIDNNVVNTVNKGGVQLTRYADGNVVMCYAHPLVSALVAYRFVRTVNGGLTWTSPAEAITSDDDWNSGACAASPGGGVFFAYGSWDSANKLSYSTDEGLNWVVLTPPGPSASSILGVGAAALNDTSWALSFATASVFSLALTTTTTVFTTVLSVAGGVRDGGKTIAIRDGSLTDIMVGRAEGFPDPTVTFTQTASAPFFTTGSSGGSEGDGVGVAAPVWVGENHAGVATTRRGTANVDEPCWFSNTDDLGTWLDQSLVDIGAEITVSHSDITVNKRGEAVVISCAYGTTTSLTVKTFLQTGVGAAVIPTTSISVSGLVGFDVDRTGSLIITREGSGTTISTYSALSLANLASTSTADCSRSDGVMAIASMVMYVQCTAGNVVDSLEIKGPTLGAPTWPPGCDFCPDSIDIADYDHDEVREVKDLIRFPIDRSEGFSDSSFFSSGRADAAWGFSTEDNFVGVMTHTARNDAADGQFTASVAYGTAFGADQLCVGQLSEGAEPYMTAVDGASPTRSWDLDFSIGASGGFPVGELEVVMDNAIIYTSAYGSAVAVDCAGDRVIAGLELGASDDVVVFQKTNGALLWRASTVDVAPDMTVRGVTISGNGEFAAYVLEQTAGAAETVRVVYASNGTLITEVTSPGGPFHSMSIDHTGANLWIATTTLINRYDISIATGASGTIPTGPPAGVNGDVPVVFGGQEVAGLGGFGTNLFLGVMMVAGMTVTMAGAPSMVAERQLGFNRFLAIIGAILGVLLAWAFGLFSNGTIFTIVVLAGLVTVFWIRSR